MAGACVTMSKQIHAVLDEVVASARARAGDGEPSVINHLFEARDENGAPLDSEALRNEIAVLFMAGHETTANTLAWTWYLLSQAPEVEAKLHEELDTVLDGRAPTLADVPQLVYTHAILDEALRLYPPVPILPREAIKEEEFQGVRIPKGSLLFVVPWLLHRHRKLWELPDHFIPERFHARKCGQDFQVRLCAVQHRPAHLRRRDLWRNGSPSLHCHAGAEIQITAAARACGAASLPSDPAP